MLHILFIIFKILLILLLSVIGLVVACLLAILFVPVRYRLSGQFASIREIKLKLHFHWLFHIVSLRFSYEDELKYKLKLFGFSILGSENKETSDEDNDVNDDKNGDEIDVKNDVKNAEALIKKADDTSRKTDTAIERAEETADLLEELVKKRQSSSENSDKEEIEKPFKTSVETSEKKADNKKNEKGSANDSKKESNKKSFKSLISEIPVRIKKLFNSVKQKLSKIIQGVKNSERKRQEIMAFLQDEDNKYSFRLIKLQLKRLLKHISPKKMSGNIAFGVEDPYLMGQILSAAAFFYPFYGEQLQLVPVMNTNEFNGDFYARGRLQIGIILFLVLRVWMNKNFRTQFYKYRNRGGR